MRPSRLAPLSLALCLLMSGAAFAAPAQVGDTKIKSAAQSFKTAVNAFKSDYKERREVAGPGLFKRMAMKTGQAIKKVGNAIGQKLLSIHDTTVATVRVAKSAIHNEREKIAAARAERKAARAEHENGGIISLNLNDTARAKPAAVKVDTTPVAEQHQLAALPAPVAMKALPAPAPMKALPAPKAVPLVEMNEQKALPAPREMKLLTAGTPEVAKVDAKPVAKTGRWVVSRAPNGRLANDFQADGEAEPALKPGYKLVGFKPAAAPKVVASMPKPDGEQKVEKDRGIVIRRVNANTDYRATGFTLEQSK
jgi:hypothetical protein